MVLTIAACYCGTLVLAANGTVVLTPMVLTSCAMVLYAQYR